MPQRAEEGQELVRCSRAYKPQSTQHVIYVGICQLGAHLRLRPCDQQKRGRNPGPTSTRFGSSFGSVSRVLRRSLALACATLVGLVLSTSSCGDGGLIPTTVDPGADFVQEDVVFDDVFFYCKVEPMLFAQGCGSGVAGKDPANGCHFSVTKFRLTDYMPHVGDSCVGGTLGPGTAVPTAAQQNYTAAQARMKRDPKLAPLLLRPTGQATHPRKIFEQNSPEADVIRQWATQFSSQ
jgi:hypothetical protein